MMISLRFIKKLVFFVFSLNIFTSYSFGVDLIPNVEHGNGDTKFLGFGEETRSIFFVEKYNFDDIENVNAQTFDFKVGQIIVFSAEANPGFIFSHWEVNGARVNENPEFEFKMPNQNVNVVAHFNKLSEPFIRIINPSSNATYEINDVIPVKFESRSDNGRISKIELFRNGQFLISSNDPNIVFNIGNLQVGNTVFTARATDDKGAAAVSPEVRVQIINANVPPEVKIISPGNGEIFPEGAGIRIEAEAFDSDGKVEKVDFYSNGIFIGSSITPPYSVYLGNPKSGSYSVTARAFDDRGRSTISNPIEVIVKPVKLISDIEFVTPIQNQNFEFNEPILLSVMFAGTDENVRRVEFYNGSQLVGFSESSPFGLEWKVDMPGEYELKAVAIGGFPEIRKESSIVKIRVKNIPFEIITPSRNAKLIAGADLRLSVRLPISQNKIKSVEFFRGNQRLGTTSETPYVFIWRNIPRGEFNLVARLIYEDNSSVLSNVIRVFSENIPLPRFNIAYNLLERGNKDSRADISFEVEIPSVINEVSGIEYYVNDSKIGSSDISPFGFDWKDVEPGNYRVFARLIDSNGMQINSNDIIVKVGDLVKEVFEDSKKLFYVIGPNPTSDWLNVYFEDMEETDDLKINLISSSGIVNKVFETKVKESKVTLDLMDVKPGVYILQLELGNKYLPAVRFIKN